MIDLARFARGASLAALAAALTLTAAPAFAQDGSAPAAQAERSYSIAAQPLDQALAQFARAADVQLAYSAELVSGRSSPGVSGSFTAREALARLLDGTGLSFRMTDGRTFTLLNAGGTDGEQMTGVVSVEGFQGSPYFGGAGQAAGVNGTNGSRDITATEGTGSFTSGALTIGSKVPQALKDVPQSISVLTSERLEQQNVTDFTTAMKELPGVSLVQGSSSLENTFYSRGFAITRMQVDGGAPIVTGSTSVWGMYPQIDMSIYDHVELLRGADGQFGAYGDPGGTVNLVRKKPLDHPQYTLDAQIGSWQNYRIVADATSPLALDGRLRGRLVMTWQNNHYFYDTAKDNKTLIYGIAEFDATPTTLLTAGVDYTQEDAVPWYNGLPRYQNGDDLKLPRSTSFVFPWNRWNFRTTDIFGSIEQKIGDDWTLKVNATYNDQQSLRKLGFSSGAVNPLTDAGPRLFGQYNNSTDKQLSVGADLAGAFTLFGQRQEVTAGFSRVSTDAGGLYGYAGLISGTAASPYQPYPGGPLFCTLVATCAAGVASPPIDMFDFDPNDPNYTEPRDPLPSVYYPVYRQIQSAAYINLRLTAFDRLHLNTGIHWSRYAYNYEQQNLCTNTLTSCTGLQIGDVWKDYTEGYKGGDISWPPPVNISFDITKSLTAYAGYTDIYQTQANLLDVNHNHLGPITGANWEGGVKWAPQNGRFNLSLSAYRIKQHGFGQTDFSVPSETVTPGVYCCFVAQPGETMMTQGFDFEAAGQLRRGLQISASYTYNQTKFDGAFYGDANGTSFLTIVPKSLYKVWLSYDFEAAGDSSWLRGLTLSGGINGQSSGFYAGTVCVNLNPANPVTGISTCKSNSKPDTEPYSFTVPAYAIVSGRIDYRFSRIWSLAINFDNLLDKTYYQAAGSTGGGNWYGTPRSFTAALRAKW